MRYKKFALPAVLAAVAIGVLTVGMSAQGSPAHLTTLTCGSTLTQSTTLAANLDCSAYSGTAVSFGANGVTLNLNGHSITADGGHECVYGDYNGDVVTTGTLNGCTTGVDLEDSIGGGVKNVTINAPTTYGVYGEYDAGANFSGVVVSTVGAATGVYLEYGAKNAVNSSRVFGGSGSGAGIQLYEEVGDNVAGNTVSDGGASFTNFYGDLGNLNTWSGNTSTGSEYGFYLYCDDYGTVTATGNTATGASSDGFYTYYCVEDEAYPPTAFSKIANNVSSGNAGYGFDDYLSSNMITSGNKANGNTDGGFYFEYPVAETITGNTATQNLSDGFYFSENYDYYSTTNVTSNIAKNNQGYGFDADYGQATSSSTSTGNTDGACYIVTGCSG
jgi:parallel beta-helix repeat protein